MTSINKKEIVTVREGKKFLKVNDRIKVIITSEKFDNKPMQAKLWSENYNYEKLNDIQRIIHLFFNENIPVIEDNNAVFWHDMNLDKYILNALQPMVKIDGGGVLWIEKTKAATLIDIDTKDLLINNEDQMLKFCKKAFVSCINQIKLRNI